MDDSAAQENTPRGAQALRIGFVVVVAIILLYPVARIAPLIQAPLARANIAIQFPWFQMDNEEGALLFQTLQLKRGRSIYRPITDYPYVVGTYPPLYMMLNSIAADAEEPTFLSGRVLSLAACVGIAVLIFTIILLRTGHLIAAMLAPVLFLASYEVHGWLPYFRVDFLSIFFSILGLGCIVVAPRDRTGRIVSIVAFAAAFFTKQTQIAAPLAVITWLLFWNARVAARYILWLIIAIGVPFAVLTGFTRGQFAIHTIIYNMNRFNPGDLVIWARHLWLFYHWLILAAVAALLGLTVAAIAGKRSRAPAEAEVEAAAKRPQQPFLRDPIVFYMLFSILNYGAIGKTGSAENYLIEPLAAFSLGICDAAGRFSRALAARRVPIVSAASLAAISILLVLHGRDLPHYAPVMFGPGKDPSASDLASWEYIIALVAAEPGDTLAEIGGLNVIAGQRVHFQPFIMSELARQGRWDPTQFVRDLRAHKFSTVVLTFDVENPGHTPGFTPEMISAIRKGYRFERRLASGKLWHHYIYRPRRIPKPRLDVAERN